MAPSQSIAQHRQTESNMAYMSAHWSRRGCSVADDALLLLEREAAQHAHGEQRHGEAERGGRVVVLQVPAAVRAVVAATRTKYFHTHHQIFLCGTHPRRAWNLSWYF